MEDFDSLKVIFGSYKSGSIATQIFVVIAYIESQGEEDIVPKALYSIKTGFQT
jgi:hypothetical protein